MERPSRRSRPSEQLLGARPFRPHHGAQPPLVRLAERGDLEGIAGGDDQALLAGGEADQHGIAQPRLGGDPLRIGIRLGLGEVVEVDGGGHQLALEEALVAGLAALRHDGKPGVALAQRPLQQRIVAAAHDRRRLGRQGAVRAHHAAEQPAVEIGAREQPLARHLGAGDLPVRDQLIELALLQPQVVRGLRRRQQAQTCVWLHFPASDSND